MKMEKLKKTTQQWSRRKNNGSEERYLGNWRRENVCDKYRHSKIKIIKKW